MITREEFESDEDLRRMEVETPSGTVLLRELSVGENLDMVRKYKHLADGVEGEERDFIMSLVVIAVGICGPDGTSMFGADEIEVAVAALKRKPQRTVEALQVAFVELNGTSEDQVLLDVGNSIEIPTESSSSDSPGISDTHLQSA